MPVFGPCAFKNPLLLWRNTCWSESLKEKTVEHDHYRASEWGQGFFRIDEQGFLRVFPRGNDEHSVKLQSVVEDLAQTHVDTPLVVRFPQILLSRQKRIRDAFLTAIDEYGYQATYQGVFPVKVNHSRIVVDTLVRGGKVHDFGLEVGSKAELCLGLTYDLSPGAFLVCNGFKDRAYLRLACLASQAGRPILLIAENPQEVADIIEIGEAVGHMPMLGFRARLHAQGSGRWLESSGHKGKFGLSTMAILEGMEAVARAGFEDRLVALHFHIGSQVSDILNIKRAIKEASRLFAAMKQKAPSLRVLDLGGGMGVDYDGSRTATDWSVNYSIEEYARDAVYMVKEICDEAEVSAPILVSESGRALCASHAVFVLSSLRVIGEHESRDYSQHRTEANQIDDLKATLAEVNDSNFREAVHDATQLLNELLSGFRLGYVTMDERAVGECLYRDICTKVRSLMIVERKRTDDLVDLEKQLAPKVVCNFSVFMSAPDSWAVQQLFPICPLARADESRRWAATIGDITCDSDGKLDRFIGKRGVEPYIRLPEPVEGEPYHVGMFLTGAYQDVLGDYHNLFGTVNEVVVEIDEENKPHIKTVVDASTVEHSLEQFGFSFSELAQRFMKVEGLEEGGEIDSTYQDAFFKVLKGNTYLNKI